MEFFEAFGGLALGLLGAERHSHGISRGQRALGKKAIAY